MRVEEVEKLKERQATREQTETLHNEDVREARQMLDVVELTAEEGTRTAVERLERLKGQLEREKEETERRLQREGEERRRRLAEAERVSALRARQEPKVEPKVKVETERKEATDGRQSEAAVKARVDRAAAEQKALADARQAEKLREEARKEQRKAEAERVAKADAERALKARREAELSAKQEREREERARWTAEQQRTRAASAPPPQSTPAVAVAAASSMSASVRHPSAEMRRLEEEAVRSAREQQQQEERKEQIIVQEERDRLARAAEREKAQQQQQQQAAAEVERKRAEAALQEQRKAELKRKEEEAEDRRKREVAAKAAAVENERQRKKDAEVQRLQQQQQAEVIRTLQERAAVAHPPVAPTSAPRASVVVISPGTAPRPPPAGGPGEAGPTIVATPAPPVVKTDLNPTQLRSRTPSWLPYALIALGGGLMAVYISRRRRGEEPESTVTTVTQTWVPAVQTVEVGGLDEGVPEEVVWSVALPEVQRPQLRKAAEPPQLLPLPPPPPIPEVNEEDLLQVLPAISSAATSSASVPSSSESPQPLQQLLEQLEGLHLQQLLSSLSDLRSEEANYLRAKLRSALTHQLHQLSDRVKELRSGVEVSVAAPLISHHSELSAEQQHSIDNLKSYLASLHRQYEFLTNSQSTQSSPADPPLTAPASSDSSTSSPSQASSDPPSAISASLVSLNAERAKSEVEKQMTSPFSALLREVDQQAEQVIQQLVELERSVASSLMQRRTQQVVDQHVDEAVEEERERWKEVESSELRQQRDDLLALTRLYLQRQRQQLDLANDEERRKRMEEVDALTHRMRSFLAAFQRIVDETRDSDRLHQVALAALALDSLSREEEVEREEEGGRQRAVAPDAAALSGLVAEWRRLWRLRSSDEVIDAAVSSIPSHVLTSSLPSVPQLKRRWRRVQAALKEEAFVPKAAEQEGLGRSPWAQVVGKLFSLLYLSPASASAAEVEGEEGEVGVIDRMNGMVGEKRWGEVLRLEGQLSPPCRALCEEWVRQVEDRLIVEQALQAVKARVICLSCAYDT